MLIMSLKTKITCAVMSAAMIFTFTGCSQKADTKTIAEYNGEQIPVGIYLYGMANAIEDAKVTYIENLKKVQDSEEKIDINKIDIVSAEIEDGVKGEEWILNKSKEYLYNYLAVNQIYNKYGYTLPTTDEEDITQLIDTQKAQIPDFIEYLNKIGVSEDSYKKNMKLNYMINDMFPKYYGENGVAPVSEEEYKAQYELKYRRAFMMPISLMDTNGAAYEADKKKEIQDKAAEYLKRLNDGESLEDVTRDYYKYSTGTEAEESDEKITSSLIDKDNTNFPENFIELLDKSKEGEYVMAENDFTIIIAKKDDLFSNMEDFENMKSSLLQQMKGEEFKNIIDEEAKKISADVKFNENSLKRYNVKDFAKRAK